MPKGHSDASACVLEGQVTQGQKHSSYPDPQILAAAPCAWERSRRATPPSTSPLRPDHKAEAVTGLGD